ncbi:MAG: YhbY family RNA-binding protein [Casimicrobiaceae bacterium]
MNPLTPALRRELRAKAHHLQPVVSVGQHGLTPSVLKEIDVNLLAHQLIKVRVFDDEREAREAMLERICTALDALPVQHIGKLLVVWRRATEPPPAKPAARPSCVRSNTAAASKGARGKAGSTAKETTMAKSTPMARRPRSPMARTTTRPAAPRSTGGAAGRTPSAQARRRRGQGA